MKTYLVEAFENHFLFLLAPWKIEEMIKTKLKDYYKNGSKQIQREIICAICLLILNIYVSRLPFVYAIAVYSWIISKFYYGCYKLDQI
jgi:hypothetical protein